MISRSVPVILEEKDFVVLNKPAGMLVHSPRGLHSDDSTIADFVALKYPETKGVGDNPAERPGIIHRLDKDTSGVMVVARTNDFFEHLKKCFQNSEVKQTYSALVFGRVPLKGIINAPIGLKSGSVRHSTRARNMKMVKSAVTEYSTSARFVFAGEDFSLLEVTPRTGRTHQIRVHFLGINHPVVGDQMYGKRNNPWGLKRQFLHAESIEFPLSDGKRFRVEADLPDDLSKILKELESKKP